MVAKSARIAIFAEESLEYLVNKSSNQVFVRLA